MKYAFSLLITLLTIFSLIINAFAVDVAGYKEYDKDKHYFYSDGNKGYYVSTKDNCAIINELGKEIREITLDKNIIGCNYVNGKFYFLTKLYDTGLNKGTKIEIYDYKTQKFDCVEIPQFTTVSRYLFAPDYSGNIYIATPDKNTVYKYSSKGEILDKYDFIDHINQIAISDGKAVFLISDNISYKLSNSQLYKLSDNYVDYPVTIFSNRYMASGSKILDMYNDCVAVDDYKNDKTSAFKNGIITANKNKLYYSPIGEKATKSYVLENSIDKLYSSKDKIFALTDSGAYTLLYNELKKISYPKSNSNKSSNTNINGNTTDKTDNKDKNNDTKSITSNTYNIGSKYITGINSVTTVSAFKENINYDGYELSFFSNGNLKSKGNIGTDMKAKFKGTNKTQTFTLIVMGDITKEGNVNSKDTQLLMKYLLSETELSDSCKIAANIIEDGTISNADLVAMSQMRK